MQTSLMTKTTCYHCGEHCEDEPIQFDKKPFCCEGCKMVYEVLNTNDLCTYYDLNDKAGISLKAGKNTSDYTFLDDPEVQQKLIDFEDDTIVKITFYLPQIHCTACIWLLENLYRLQPNVIQSKVNFLKKEAYVTFLKKEITLREVVRLMASIGYPPEINFKNLDGDSTKRSTANKTFFYKLGLAGFAFGNIMLVSFPEYLGLNKVLEGDFYQFFGYLNLLLALPVLLYSSTDYFKSAWYSLKQKRPNIDVPIALGISVLFLRSTFEILTQTGAGYLDSMTGLVFFLLIGKWFQRKTYDTITFDRDYKSYFPIAAIRKKGGVEEEVALTKLDVGDTIVIQNQGLIPADAILLKGRANIDYSFVTGEAEPIRKKAGETLYAGGRQVGDAIEITITKAVSQSYLTQLWNDDAFTKPTSNFASLIDRVGRYFTVAILIIAFITAGYWLVNDPSVAMNAFTAVLIIACPCAIALAIPFTLGNALRILGKNRFYVKNTDVIERMQGITDLVFDKTGTLSSTSNNEITYEGTALTETEKELVFTLAKQSSHPISRKVADQLGKKITLEEKLTVSDFQEIIGGGIEAIINGSRVRLGSEGFVFNQKMKDSRGTFVEIDGQVKGFFTIKNKYRKCVEPLIITLQRYFNLSLLSGDNDRERQHLTTMFKPQQLHFNQQPKDKLEFVRQLQDLDRSVMMLGDGLNDAGALKQSEVGVAVSENLNHFSPACDAILDASRLHHLWLFIRYARGSMKLVRYAFVLSFIYNVIGLSFAVQGLLEPVVAAILMPLSSITIVIFGMASTALLAKRLKL